MRVLVTGHHGFIGSVMVPLLLEERHDVVGMDTDYYRDCNFAGPPADVPSIPRDIRDAKPSDLAGFDAVIHLAALSNDPLGEVDPELTYEVNHRATVHLARLARDAQVTRFLFSSSCSNYGASGDGLLDENAPFNPVTPYGVSKVRAEQDLLALATDEFSPVLLRSATAYGVSPRLRCDLVLNNLTAWAVATGKVLIKSDGTPWRPIVHVEDICRAFLAVLAAPREVIHGQAFNVGRPEENYRVHELAEIVRQTVPGCTVELAGGAGPDKRNYRVDCSKIARLLPGFRPAWTARQGARQLYEAFRESRITVENFEGFRFRRLGQIEKLRAEGKLDGKLRWSARPAAPEQRTPEERARESGAGGHSGKVPRVSIGLAVYNGERYLREAVQSILAQTYQDFELIISDNASTDGTAEICKEYAAQDPRIRYSRNPTNIGGANNENLTVRLARGEYFRWAAHDDICAPTLIERCVEILDKNPEVVLCYSAIISIDENGQQTGMSYGRKGTALNAHQRFRELSSRQYACEATYGLIRTDVLRRIQPHQNYTSADRVLLCELALYGPFVQLEEHLFYKRFHPGNRYRDWRGRMAWFLPELQRSGRVTFPNWLELFGYVDLLRRVPLPWVERQLCRVWIASWLFQHAKSLVKDVMFAAYMTLRSRTWRARWYADVERWQ